MMVMAAVAMLMVEPSDHVFHAVMERWVLDFRRPQSLEEIFGEEDAELIRMLGCDRHACRKHAIKELLHERYYLTALKGSWLKDPQISSLCQYLLSMWVCPTCNGRGKTIFYTDWGSYYSYCERCGGNGK